MNDWVNLLQQSHQQTDDEDKTLIMVMMVVTACVICRMVNAECDFSLLGQQKYMHRSLNPNPIANSNPKITQSA